jgi:hypothetical protein
MNAIPRHIAHVLGLRVTLHIFGSAAALFSLLDMATELWQASWHGK